MIATALTERLRAHGYTLPDYDGGGLVNLATTVLDLCGAWDPSFLPPLRDLDPALRDGVKQVVVILADGLGYDQLQRLAAAGELPFLATILERAAARDRAQLIDATTIFPSTTAAAITTLNTARTPQEHGSLAYHLWLEEFGQVAQMLRWGPGVTKRGSFFDDASIDPRAYARVRSIYGALREQGTRSYIVQPELFRREPTTRMYGSEAEYVGYVVSSTMGVRLRQLLDERPWGSARAYIYAYWSGVDTVTHLHGPRGPEHAAEAAALDTNLRRALGGRPAGDTLVILTADHGLAAVDPAKLVDLEADTELRALLRHPIAGEPRVAFLHTDVPDRVHAHLEAAHPGTFFLFDRDEAIAAGLFGRGDATAARQRVGDVLAMIGDDRGASTVRVDGQLGMQRGSHGGMTPDEMRIPVLLWRA